MKHLIQLLKEMIPVVLGILIALFINNWNEERKDRAYLNQIFSSIKMELEESNRDIERVLPKQKATVDTIMVYLHDEQISLYEIMMKAQGIYSPSIKTNSWNAIANSKIELMAYEELSALADIEERKQNLTDRIEKQAEFTFQNFERTEKAKKEILIMMLRDVIGAELDLQAAIKDLIKSDDTNLESQFRKTPHEKT